MGWCNILPYFHKVVKSGTFTLVKYHLYLNDILPLLGINFAYFTIDNCSYGYVV